MKIDKVPYPSDGYKDLCLFHASSRYCYLMRLFTERLDSWSVYLIFLDLPWHNLLYIATVW